MSRFSSAIGMNSNGPTALAREDAHVRIEELKAVAATFFGEIHGFIGMSHEGI
jgi:hypothetical protein